MAIRPKLSRLRRASASVAKILTEALKSMAETHWEEAGSGRPITGTAGHTLCHRGQLAIGDGGYWLGDGGAGAEMPRAANIPRPQWRVVPMANPVKAALEIQVSSSEQFWADG